VTGALLVAGLSAIALGGALGVWRRAFSAGLHVQAAGAAAVAVAGFWALGSQSVVGDAFASSFGPRFGVDGLSGFFLGILGLIAAPALVFSARYLRPSANGRAVGALTAVFVLALALVLCARDPLTFLTGWETMTLVPAVVILVSRRADRRARHTVFNYLAVTHLGGAGTWVAILLLAHADAIGGQTTIASGSGLQTAIALSALVGMGTKAGVMPLHVWLPRAHPSAPAPVSALMSGVMIKVALYGLVRVLLEWDGVLPVWFGVLVLGVGALSAVGGVVYALFEHDLKRLLAFHSIENIGIIVLGIGASLVLRARGADMWAAFAARRRAAPHREPRGLQGAALPRRGRLRARGRLARDRPARRPSPPDALVGWGVPRRSDGNCGPPAAERLRIGVADAAGAASRIAIRARR